MFYIFDVSTFEQFFIGLKVLSDQNFCVLFTHFSHFELCVFSFSLIYMVKKDHLGEKICIP